MYKITWIFSARWAKSERPDSLSLLHQDSAPQLPLLSKKSLTINAKSCSLSWLNAPPPRPPMLTHKSPPGATQTLQSIPPTQIHNHRYKIKIEIPQIPMIFLPQIRWPNWTNDRNSLKRIKISEFLSRFSDDFELKIQSLIEFFFVFNVNFWFFWFQLFRIWKREKKLAYRSKRGRRRDEWRMGNWFVWKWKKLDRLGKANSSEKKERYKKTLVVWNDNCAPIWISW